MLYNMSSTLKNHSKVSVTNHQPHHIGIIIETRGVYSSKILKTFPPPPFQNFKIFPKIQRAFTQPMKISSFYACLLAFLMPIVFKKPFYLLSSSFYSKTLGVGKVFKSLFPIRVKSA